MEQSKKPFVILMAASVLRAWAVFAAITFLPMYLVTQGYDLMTASLIMTLMLLAGVAGQVIGGRISDRIGRKEFMVFVLAGAIPFFYLFFATRGSLRSLLLLLRVLPLVHIRCCRGDGTRAPAAERGARLRDDARPCHRIWRARSLRSTG